MPLATVVAMACLVASGAFAVPGAHQDPRDDHYQSPLDHSELAAPRSEVVNLPARSLRERVLLRQAVPRKMPTCTFWFFHGSSPL